MNHSGRVSGISKKFALTALIALAASTAQAAEYIVLFNTGSPVVQSRDQVVKHAQDLAGEMQKSFALPGSSFFAAPIRAASLYWAADGALYDLNTEQARALESSDRVAAVIPNYEVRLPDFHPTVVENKDLLADQATYGLINTGVVALRQSRPSVDGKGVVVGVLDTGIAADHPDLRGKLIAFKDFVGGQTDPYDDHGHGTHVSGTIAGGNASGTAIGVAPGANLVVGKIFDRRGSSSLDKIMAGMQWIIDFDGNGAHPALVSNSWGMGQKTTKLANEPMKRMVDAWLAKNVVPVFAAGNSGPSTGTLSVPAGLPGTVAVAAVDSSSSTARFSSRGPISWTDTDGNNLTLNKPDIAAPGVKVYSSLPGGKYGEMDGTSMATPHVAGVLALYVQTAGSFDAAKAVDTLCASARRLNRAATETGCGFIQANPQ